MLLLPFLVACGGDGEGVGESGTLCSDSTRYQGPTGTVNLYLSMPGGFTRVADPGDDTQETADWDLLTIVVTYATPPADGKAVRPVTITYDDYTQLTPYASSPDVKILPLTMPEGTVHVYGYTHSSGAKLDFDVEGLADEAAVRELHISNAYTSDLRKFCSVATGFYVASDATDKAAPGDLVISPMTQGNNDVPILTLRRLATKLDIQWDAQDAYTAGLSNVKVTSFTYDGGQTYANEAEKAGYGRLFPALASTATALGGQCTFVNQTEISKRNGRVVHYVFPDGYAGAKVTFNVTSTQSSSAATSNTYTFSFTKALEQATWYKVNATIVGNSGNSSVISIDF